MGPLIALKPGQAATAFAANDAPGFVRVANTAKGNPVNVWVPAANAAPKDSFFCHGHALGTFTANGYSVFSGPDLQTVLKDEWNLVGSLQNMKLGDIVVWYNVHAGAPARLADHSALILTVGMGSDLKVDVVHTTLSSKNGTEPLTPKISLDDLIKTYGSTYALFRRQ